MTSPVTGACNRSTDFSATLPALGPRPSTAGSVTLVALCFTAVLAIALASYLRLCQRSYDFSTRQLHNDRARQLAQTGLEEALWALNQNTWNSSGPNSDTTWTTSGANRTVTLAFGSLGQGATGQVALTVANYASAGPTWPTITALATITLDSGRVYTRTLQATTGPAPLFGNAIASGASYVSFTSGGTVDSWNSDPDNNPATAAAAYSFTAGTAGNYAAVIAADDSGSTSVSINQAQVYGYLATTGQTVSYSTSGSPPGRVKGPSTAGGVNVDPERLGKSAFIPTSPVFSIVLPPTTGATYGGLIGNILDLLAALLGAPSGEDTYKTTGNLSITGVPLVAPSLTVSKPMRLIVDGSLTISGTGKITVTSTGSLELWVASDLSIGGSGIVNQTNDPRKVAIYCMDSSTSNSVQYTTTADFCGVIYSENKPIDIRQNATFYGALLSGQYVRFSNSATSPVFHYDTALRNVRFSGISTPYVILQLTEP